jgi:peptidoglycan/LPS O-acetylase OafA/YrhL
MQQRQRKLAGTVALLILVCVYAALALAVAIVLQVQNANKIVELIYYVVAGLLWVLPAAFLIKWMQKPDASAD